jgi:hypothetical protein
MATTTRRSKYAVREFKGAWVVIDTTSETPTKTLDGEVITRTLTEEHANEFLARLQKEEK